MNKAQAAFKFFNSSMNAVPIFLYNQAVYIQSPAGEALHTPILT